MLVKTWPIGQQAQFENVMCFQRDDDGETICVFGFTIKKLLIK